MLRRSSGGLAAICFLALATLVHAEHDPINTQADWDAALAERAGVGKFMLDYFDHDYIRKTFPQNPSYTWTPTNPFVIYVMCDENRADNGSKEAGNGNAAVIHVKNAKPLEWVEVAFSRNRGDATWEPSSDCKITSGLGMISTRTEHRSDSPSGGGHEEHWGGGSKDNRRFRARADEQGYVKFRHYVEDCDTFYYQAIGDANGEDCVATEAVPANNNFVNPQSKNKWVIDNDESMANLLLQRHTRTSGALVESTVARWVDMTKITKDLDVQLRFASNAAESTLSDRWDEYHNKGDHSFLPFLDVPFTVPMEFEVTMRRTKCCSNGMMVLLSSYRKLPGDVLGGENHLGNYDYKKFGSMVRFYQCCSGSVLGSSYNPDTKRSPYIDTYRWFESSQFNDYGNHDFSADVQTHRLYGPEGGNTYSDYTMVPNGRHSCSYEMFYTRDRYEDMRYKVTVPGDGTGVKMKIREPQGKELYHDSVFRTQGTRISDSGGDYENWWFHGPVSDERYVPNPFTKGDTVYLNLHGGWADDQMIQLYYATETTDEALDSVHFKQGPVPTNILDGTLNTRGDSGNFWHGEQQRYWNAETKEYEEFSYSLDSGNTGFFDYDGDLAPDSGNIMVGLTAENLSDDMFA